MITDEMAKKALDAYWQNRSTDIYDHIRAAIEVVAPMLIAEAFETRPPALLKDALDKALNKARAQGMREAAEMEGDSQDQSQGWLNDLVSRKAILARAQELDPR